MYPRERSKIRGEGISERAFYPLGTAHVAAVDQRVVLGRSGEMVSVLGVFEQPRSAIQLPDWLIYFDSPNKVLISVPRRCGTAENHANHGHDGRKNVVFSFRERQHLRTQWEYDRQNLPQLIT